MFYHRPASVEPAQTEPQAATAGVVGVCLEEAQPVPRFAVLTRREPNGAVLEIFEETSWRLEF